MSGAGGQRPIGPAENDQRLVRSAARALGRAGLAHAYGHCSMRLDASSFLVCAPRPMGLLERGEAGIVVDVDGPLPAGVLGEVRLHQQIYRRRPDVGGVVRAMPPQVMALSAARRTPVPRHGMGSYFLRPVPLWDDVQLVRSDAQAEGVIDALGDAPALVMRGNGSVVCGPSLEAAVVLTWYLEDAARIELALFAAGLDSADARLTENETAARATTAGGIFERMWAWLTQGDDEAQPMQPPAVSSQTSAVSSQTPAASSQLATSGDA